MNLTLNLAALLLIAPAAWSQQTLIEYDWKDISQKNLIQFAVPIRTNGRAALKIENTNDTELKVNLITAKNPPITSMLYALTGEIRYDSVQGEGYLEMWSVFKSEKPGQPENQFFSRTRSESGKMSRISGTSDWREFQLPFDRTGAEKPLVRLQVNLVLPGRGTVYIGPVRLIEFPWAAPANSSHSWWSNRTSIWLSSVGGSLIGCLGGLCGLLSGQGKARVFVLAMLTGLSFLGGALGIAGLLAIGLKQPYDVVYPLIGGAVILLCVCPGVLRQSRKRYELLELRRIESIDASAA